VGLSVAEALTALETLPISAYIGESWWFPFLESIHVVTAAFLVGSIAMVDLRLLGLAALGQPVGRLTKEVLPWTWGACTLSLLTGFGLFATRATHYAGNIAFQLKMALLVLAAVNMAVFHLSTSRRIAQWDTEGTPPLASRAAGASSLLFWIGVILAGRWIGHLL